MSQSRQFAIFGTRNSSSAGSAPSGSVVLEPDLLAITAERIRHAVAAEVPAIASPGRQINLHILEQSTPNGVIGIVSTLYTDGWQYRVGIPPVADESRLAKALIQALLIEYAQRVGERGIEMPAWVVEGVAQKAFYSIGPKLVVGRNSTGWEGSMRDLNGRTRETLRTNSAPSFNDLTTLAPPPAGAPAEALYQASAHLLVHSLLQLPNGRRKFAAFLQMLPLTWNWQTAFREAYGFERMLDVEKWWALVTVEFTTRDLRQAWSPEASLRKLDELLATRVEVRTEANSIPEPRVIDLQTVLREIDWAYQRAAFTEKASLIGYTAPHFSSDISALALQYQKALKTYLDQRERGSVRPGLPMPPESVQQRLVDETIKRIDALDAKRRALAEPTTVSSAR